MTILPPLGASADQCGAREAFVPVSPSEASSSGGMTPLIVMGLLRIWVFSESVEFDMVEILWVIGTRYVPEDEGRHGPLN